MPIPKLSGFTITKNKVWSRNAGRNDNADMVGTIIAIKRKIQIEWPPLSSDEVATIDSVVSNINNPFVEVQYTDETNNTTTITAYFGDATYPVYTMNANGNMILSGVKVDGIEQ